MSESKTSSRDIRRTGLIVVILLSFLSLELVILSGRVTGKWDSVFSDLFMRWRSTLAYSGMGVGTDNLVLIAIDGRTQDELGRYGAGKWLSRRPFVDNIRHLQKYFRPSVLGYDIVFIDDFARENGDQRERISESRGKLAELAKEITDGLSGAGDTIPRQSLADMNRLVIEQGNKSFVNACAEVQENEGVDILFGYFFRGGGVDPQIAEIEPWSDWDVHGNTAGGDEDMGARIPYLKDMSIPFESISFPKGTLLTKYEPSPNASLPFTDLLDYSSIGPLNVPRDDDGVVRRVPMLLSFRYRNSPQHVTREYYVPSFSLMASMLHLGMEFPLKEEDIEVVMGDKITLRPPEKGEHVIPIDEKGRLYLNYDNSFSDFAELCFSRFVRYGKTFGKDIDGRVAIVGVTVTGVDVGATPLDSNIPLVFVQMTAINNILTNSFIAPLREWRLVTLWAVLLLAVTAICLFEKSFKLGPALLLFGVLYFITAYMSVHQGWCVLPVVQPVLYIAVCSFTILSYRFFTEERAKRKIRGMFSTMVSDKVLQHLEANPESFSLQGRDIETTVFFSDVADFTTISENLPAGQLTALLNSYLTPVTDCIMKYDGYLDKYVGDGIMAVWGAPNPDPQHALWCCMSALEQQKIISSMNDEIENEYGVRLRVRMGIHSGIVTAGNMGSEKKFQYTVMGDTVNLASRLEPVSKEFGTRIIISQATYDAVKNGLKARQLEKIVVKGKQEVVPIYELLGKEGEVDGNTIKVASLYEEALSAFHSSDWDRAIDLAGQALEIQPDPPSVYLIERAEGYKKSPPPPSWKGEYVRKRKD